MIIWGSKGMTSTTGTGEFTCPSCQTLTPYSSKRVRRFFTLYFIPLFPIRTVSQYVECQRCTKAWDPAVLAVPPALG